MVSTSPNHMSSSESIAIQNQTRSPERPQAFSANTLEIFKKLGSNLPDLRIKLEKKGKKYTDLMKALEQAKKNPVKDTTIAMIHGFVQVSFLVSLKALGILLGMAAILLFCNSAWILAPLVLVSSLTILGGAIAAYFILSHINNSSYGKSMLSKKVHLFSDLALPLKAELGKIDRLNAKTQRYAGKVGSFFAESGQVQEKLKAKEKKYSHLIELGKSGLFNEDEKNTHRNMLACYTKAKEELNAAIIFYAKYAPKPKTLAPPLPPVSPETETKTGE